MKKIYIIPQTTCNLIAKDSFLLTVSQTAGDETKSYDVREEQFMWEEEGNKGFW